jgi:hypothetical protein
VTSAKARSDIIRNCLTKPISPATSAQCFVEMSARKSKSIFIAFLRERRTRRIGIGRLPVGIVGAGFVLKPRRNERACWARPRIFGGGSHGVISSQSFLLPQEQLSIPCYPFLSIAFPARQPELRFQDAYKVLQKDLVPRGLTCQLRQKKRMQE